MEKYGFGQWEDICEDPTLPFQRLASPLLDKSSPKSSAEHKDLSAVEVDECTGQAGEKEERDTIEPAKEMEADEVRQKEDIRDDNTVDKTVPLKSKGGKSGPLSKALGFPRDSLCKKRLDAIIKRAERTPIARPIIKPSSPSSPPLSTKETHQSSITGYLREGISKSSA